MSSNTYVALATQTLGSGVTTFTFNSVPSGYTDLILVANAGCTATGQYIALRFNSDSGTNYSDTVLEGSGSSATSNRESNLNRVQMVYQRGTDSNFGTVEWHIQNYSNSTTYKTVLGRWNFAGDGVTAGVSTWRNTAAITSITVLTSGTFTAGSTFTIYGIAAASVGAKATGGTIYQDASYFYHVFSGNGTFTPTQSISADVLVVAGGGGGNDGGGGAGGIAYFASQSLTATGYTCTVGSGGAGTSSSSPGANGVNSSFGALTAATGGGGGAYYNTGNGIAGGSGGGAPRSASTSTTGGAANQSSSGTTASYGSAGGAFVFGGTNGGGGGGGAGGVGATNNAGSTGGAGTNAYSSWLSATGLGVSGFIAGGGGAYANPVQGLGQAGGGNGSTNSLPATSGAPYTGSGGGGAAGGGASTGNGGSGVVIVRYAK